jgi:hypothetical protein
MAAMSAFTTLRDRANDPNPESKIVAEYLADPTLAQDGLGLVLIDPYLGFLQDTEELIEDGLSDHYDEDQRLRISHSEFGDRCKEDGFTTAIAEVGSVPLLILCDLWIAKSHEQAKFFGWQLNGLVAHRYRQRLPVVITSRNEASALAEAYPKWWPLVKDRCVIETLR